MRYCAMAGYAVMAVALVMGGGRSGAAVPAEEAQKLYERVRPSLVVVQYTLEGEFGRREVIGQGVVVGEEGLVVASLALAPPQIPDVQMKEFKIIIPGDDEQELDAEFLGRDERADLVYVKTKEPQKWQAITFEDVTLNVAEPVISIGLLPKDAGYRAYYTESIVSANLRGPIPLVLVSPDGLAGVGAPVFNAAGKAIGLVQYQQGQTQLLNRGNGGPPQAVMSPPRYFVPARDFARSLADHPSGQPLQIPWLGAQLSGTNKEVAAYFNLKNVPVAQVGEIIADSPAAKAGLKTGDKLLKANGEPLERGDEPDETAMILQRRISWMKPGEQLRLSVLRQRGRAPMELTVVLEERPKQANSAQRFYAEDLGLSVREVVWADTYAKRVPADTKGVTVAFVRPASSAATASLQVGDLVTQINKEPVTNLEQFRKEYQSFRQRNPRDVVVLVVIRDQRTEVIKLEPPQ